MARGMNLRKGRGDGQQEVGFENPERIEPLSLGSVHWQG